MEEQNNYKKFRTILQFYYFGSIATIGIYLFILLKQTMFNELSIDAILSSPVIILFFLLCIISSIAGSKLARACFSNINIYKNKFLASMTKSTVQISGTVITNQEKTVSIETQKVTALYMISLCFIQSGSIFGFIGSIMYRNATFYIPFVIVVITASLFSRPDVDTLVNCINEAE
ncbi:MAG: hypothetical protein JXJ04_17935 [Spirochaetales bacterium]|nr:hypothetical protein [Spirochaetales bacterium]